MGGTPKAVRAAVRMGLRISSDTVPGCLTVSTSHWGCQYSTVTQGVSPHMQGPVIFQDTQPIFGSAVQAVVYPSLADNISGALLSRLQGVTQLVISQYIGVSRPQSALFACA